MSRPQAKGWFGPPPLTHSFLLTASPNGKTRLDNFIDYLTKASIEIRPPKEWEILRFAHEDGLGIIWHNKNHSLTWSKEAEAAWHDYRQGIQCRFARPRPKMKLIKGAYAVLTRDLLARDGGNCVVCGQPLGEDLSIEHLLDRKFGGSDHSANLTLAHRKCNSELDLVHTLREKIELIIKKRQNLC